MAEAKPQATQKNSKVVKQGGSKMATEKKDEKLINDAVEDIKHVQDVVESAIEKSSKSIEEVHLAISRLPLKYLGKVKKIKEETKDVEEVQEKLIGHVYDLIRSVNTKLSDVSKDVVSLANSN